MEVTGDEGEIYLLIGIKGTGMVIDPRSPIRNTPHSMSRVFCKTKVGNCQNKTEDTTDHYLQQDNATSGLSTYFIQLFVIFNPTPKHVEYVSTYFRTRKYCFFKGRYRDLTITIEAVLFNLDRWLCIFINHMDSLRHQTALQVHQKRLGQPLRKWIMSYQLFVHESPMVGSFL